MKQLSGQDSVYLFAETASTPGHLGMLYVYEPSSKAASKTDEPVTFDNILSHMQGHLHISPVFRSKLMRMPVDIDHPYWVDDDGFDLEYHVRHIALPKPGDWRQFCVQIARLHARPLDRSKPLWEMYVIEGLDNIKRFPKGSFAVLLKVHHCAVDAEEALALTNELHDQLPDADAAVVEQWEPLPKPGLLNLAKNTFINNIKHSYEMGFDLLNATPAMGKFLLSHLRSKELSPEATSVRPDTRFDSNHVSPNRVFGGVQWTTDEIAGIQTSVSEATANDVLLSICGGALRYYLQDKEELPLHSLRAIFPMVVEEKQRRGEKNSSLHVLTPPLHTQIAEPLERLEAIHWDLATSEVVDQNAIHDFSDLTRRLPSLTMALGVSVATHTLLSRKTLASIGNCAFTSGKSSSAPLYLCGAKLRQVSTLTPILEGMTLVFNAVSYNGQQEISFQSDRELIPDPEFMESCLQRAFDELKQAAADTPSSVADDDSATIKKVSVPATAKRTAKRTPTKRAASSRKTTSDTSAATKSTATKTGVTKATGKVTEKTTEKATGKSTQQASDKTSESPVVSD